MLAISANSLLMQLKIVVTCGTSQITWVVTMKRITLSVTAHLNMSVKVLMFNEELLLEPSHGATVLGEPLHVEEHPVAVNRSKEQVLSSLPPPRAQAFPMEIDS